MQQNFTQVPNDLINDITLSRNARFLYVFMASKPVNWKFFNGNMAKMLGCHKESIIKYKNELVSAGWITKTTARDCGKFDNNEYEINASPSRKKTDTVPSRKKTDTIKNRHGFFPTHSNTILKSNTNLKEILNSSSKKEIENFYQEIKKDQTFIEKTCMSLKIKKEDIEKLLLDFQNQKEALSENTWPDYPKFRKNFYFWLSKNQVYKNGDHNAKHRNDSGKQGKGIDKLKEAKKRLYGKQH